MLLLLLAGCARSLPPAASVVHRPPEPPVTASAEPSAGVPASAPSPHANLPGAGAEAAGRPGPTVTASAYPAASRPVPQAGGPLGPALALSSLRMVSAQAGWATGWTMDRNAGGILRSTDGGGRWQVVSPPGLDPTRIQSPFFLDASHAWFVTSQGQAIAAKPVHAETTVERTADGGSTWLPSATLQLPNGGPGWLDFIDAQHGWYMANLGESGGSMAVEIFETADSGQNWASVSTTGGALEPSTPGGLPVFCNKTGVSFADLHIGWATAHCTTSGVFFYTTRDGGRTWRDQPLPPPTPDEASLFQSGDCETSPPVVPPGSDGVGVLSLRVRARGLALLHPRRGADMARVTAGPRARRCVPDLCERPGWLDDR